MPVVWDEAKFIAAYRQRHTGKNYDATWLRDRIGKQHATAFINIPTQPNWNQISSASRVVIIGSGFGWAAEWMEILVPGIEVACTDTSPWIQSALNDGNPAHQGFRTVLNEDSRTNGSRNAVRRQFAGNNDPTHVITEDVIGSFTDGELSDLAIFDSYTGANILHLVTPDYNGHPEQQNDFPELNWKTMEDWRIFLDSLGLFHHLLLKPGTFEVF